jgi:type IV fimbrial biogenesis protein FimT
MAKLRHSTIRYHHVPGFTLTELMITVAVGAILMVAAVPAYNGFIINQRVKTASHALYASLLYARGEALKRNGDVFVTRNESTWANGWIVTTSNVRTYGECVANPAPADCLQIQAPVAAIDITGGTAQLSYRRDGRAVNVGDAFVFCDAATSAHVIRRTVTIGLMGRPNITHAGNCG